MAIGEGHGVTISRAALPQFKVPEPIEYERIDHWHRRIGQELERWANEELAPALDARDAREGRQ
jgi:hypothetical protein